MADFLTSRMYHDALDVRGCLILAAYVLFQTKEHVDGCGGESHIAVLRNDGLSGRVDLTHVKEITELLASADSDLGSILLASGDLKESQREFRRRYKDILELLESSRYHAKKSLKLNSGWGLIPGAAAIDDLGIPKPRRERLKARK